MCNDKKTIQLVGEDTNEGDEVFERSMQIPKANGMNQLR
jgi:hypothetical protein